MIKNVQDLGLLKPGEILVTDKTDPDWEPAMKKAAAVVTNRGGRTCHAAIVSRELGLPAVVGTHSGTETLQDGQVVTVSCAEGEQDLSTKENLSLRSPTRPSQGRPAQDQDHDEYWKSR